MAETASVPRLQELAVRTHHDGTLVLSARRVPQLDPHNLESDVRRAVLEPLDRQLTSDPSITGIVLKGRFPLWFFAAAHVAIHRFLDKGFQENEHPHRPFWQGVFDPKLCGAVVVHSSGTPELGQIVPLSGVPPSAASQQVEPLLDFEPGHRESDLDECVVRFTSPGPDLLSPAALRQAMERLCDNETLNQADVVLLNGPYPAWLATGIALAIHRQFPHKAILVRALQDQGDVVVESGTPANYPLGLLLPIPEQECPRPPLVVGIVGDPNSGKSVLSLKLYHLLRRPGGLPCYRLDCDAYAPTAEWTLRGVGPEERRAWKETKKREQGGWTIEDEKNLALITSRIRKTPIDLLLLDLPGGDFSREPPQRIPPGRIDLFQEVDRFLLVAKDEKAKEGWTEELARIGKSKDISVIVRSKKTTVHETVTKEQVAGRKVPSIRIGQLDRNRLDEVTWGVEQLAKMIRDAVSARA